MVEAEGGERLEAPFFPTIAEAGVLESGIWWRGDCCLLITTVSLVPLLFTIAEFALELDGRRKTTRKLTQHQPVLPFSWQGPPFRMQAEAWEARRARAKRARRRYLNMVSRWGKGGRERYL